MANKYIAFLGNNNYTECNYVFEDGEGAKGVRFVQEATVDRLCRGWSRNDHVLIFLTSDARNKNWTDSKEKEGLEKRLNGLEIKANIRTVDIADGIGADGINDIFTKLVDNIDENDSIVFDITYAFRSIPMLALVALNYCKSLKKIEVKSIVYGAFEALGNKSEVEKMPLEERNAPVIDLTGYDDLLAWSTAIDRFRASGDARLAAHLARRQVNPVMKKTRGQDEQMESLGHLADSMERFAKSLSTCRGLRIRQCAARLRDNIDKVSKAGAGRRILPLEPLLDPLRQELEGYGRDEVRDGLEAVRWCLGRNMVQQGYTLLEETIVTYLVNLLGLSIGSRDDREFVSRAYHIHHKKIRKEEWTEALLSRPNQVEQVGRLIDERQGLAELMQRIGERRNDINHAGMRKGALDEDKLEGLLERDINELESILAADR